MGILHIVLFEFKPNTDPETVQHVQVQIPRSFLELASDSKNLSKVCQGMLALKDKCIHPTTKESYLKSLVGGRDNSPEGRQVGLRAQFSSQVRVS